MKKFNKKYIIYFLLILTVVSFIWFDMFFLKTNSDFFAQELKKAGESSDVIIIFNSGGFGTVEFENAYDIRPIIENTREVIENMNYKVAIVPYYRTKETIIGKIGYLKEMFYSFPKESDDLAFQIREFLKDNPEDKILMAGLSNGAAFVGATMKDLDDIKNNVSAIQLGSPFWAEKDLRENILFLDNNGSDVLTAGKKKEIITSFLKAPFKWLQSKIKNKEMSFAEAIEAPGHHYYWEDVGKEIELFVAERLGR
jgi:hypothetical protein